MVMIMWLGLLIPFFGTTLGSAIVYFIKNKKNDLYLDAFQVLPLVSWWLLVFGLY